MYSISSVGYIALVVSSLAWLPQVIKSFRTRSVRDISLGTFVLLFVGALLWLVYAVYINDRPLITAHGVTAVFTGVIVYFKLRSNK